MIVEPDARDEWLAAVDWYEDQRPGLADVFLDTFEASSDNSFKRYVIR